jgi:hypothetical protein
VAGRLESELPPAAAAPAAGISAPKQGGQPAQCGYFVSAAWLWLGKLSPELGTALVAPAPAADEETETAAPFDGYRCPACRTGRLRVIAHLAPPPRARACRRRPHPAKDRRRPPCRTGRVRPAPALAPNTRNRLNLPPSPWSPAPWRRSDAAYSLGRSPLAPTPDPARSLLPRGRRIQSPFSKVGRARPRPRAGIGLVQQTFIRRARRASCHGLDHCRARAG